jgi:predicted permease
MDEVHLKFFTMMVVIIGSMLAGYLLRKTGRVREGLAERLMTIVMVFGYTSQTVLTVWSTRLHLSDAWLPILGGLEIIIMTGLGVLLARPMTRDRLQRGVFAVSSGIGNTGSTMGGFVCYLLLGAAGMGLTGVLGLCWTPVIVLFLYPVSRHYAGDGGGSLWRLMRKSLLDWRAIPLPLTLMALALSIYQDEVPEPAILKSPWLLNTLMFGVSAMAYFAIGLRLRLSGLWPLRRMILALAAFRFIGGAVIGVGLLLLVGLTPWPMGTYPLRLPLSLSPSQTVLIVQSIVPAAVTAVGLADMFHLDPRVASALFVTNTILYLLLVLPVVVWVL